MGWNSRQLKLGVTALLALLAVIAAAQVAAQGRSDQPGPRTGVQFMLEADGALLAYFTECAGLGSEQEVIEQRIVDGNGQEIILKIPGRLAWTEVGCRRTISADTGLWLWRHQVVEGNMQDARRQVTISMLNAASQVIASWDLTNAWPSKMHGRSNDSQTAGVEEFLLVHEGLVRTQ